jgi:hypothetical protein
VLALPAEDRPARRRGFSITAAVSTKHLHVAAGMRVQPARQRLEPRLDDCRDSRRPAHRPRSRAVALLQDRQRIVVRAVVQPEHDDGAHLGHSARGSPRARPSLPSSPCRRGRLRRGTLQPLRASGSRRAA